MKVNEEQKAKAKQALLDKLRAMKMKSEQIPLQPKDVQNYSLPVPSRIAMPQIGQKRSLFNDGKPQAYLYPQVHQNQINRMVPPKTSTNPEQQIVKNIKSNEKQDLEKQEQNQKDVKSRQQIRRMNKTKKPYYQHYIKQGTYEPCLPHVREHENPSGKPTNIPEQLLSGIEVTPKRPWVYYGPENIPPTDCEEINCHNFMRVYEQAKKQKRHNTGILKKSNLKKRKGYRNEEDFSQISDDFTSNFNLSDSVDLSKDSDLISQFRSQSKRESVPQKKKQQQQQEDDIEEYSQYSMSGSVTQKQKYNLFDSDDDSSGQSQVSKKYRNEPQDSSFASEKPSSFDNMSQNVSISDQQSSAPKKRQRKKISRNSSNMKDSFSSIKQSESISIPAPRRSSRRSAKIDDYSEIQISKKKVPSKNSRNSEAKRKPLKQEQSSGSSKGQEEEEGGSSSISSSNSASNRRRSLRKRDR